MFNIQTNQHIQIKKNDSNILKRKLLVCVNWCILWLMLFFLSTSLYFILRQYKVKPISHYFINTSGCQMSVVLPDYNTVYSLMLNPELKICRYQNSTVPLVLSDETSLWLDEHALVSYGINDSQNVICCYTEVYRPVKSPNDTGSPYLYGKTCKPFWKKENVSLEFVKIICTDNGTLFYTDFHYFVPIKNHVENRCKQLSKTNEKMNVMILGLDSISRSSFHRTMNKTVNHLKNMGAIEMLGYNKVGFATIHNMVPVATGLFLEELNSTCMKNDKGYLDSCKFIWKDFETQGYRTAIIEDSYYGLYEFIGKGFHHAPTDYYSPTFYHAAEREIGDFKENEINYCIGTRMLYKTFLIYVEKFIKAMVDRSYFGLFWQFTVTHENINGGELLDDPYLLLLKRFSQHASFNKTILIMMSDHGFQRHRKFVRTKLGRSEDRRPLLTFVFPKWFHHKYLNAITNLKTNSKRLVTPFDLHETLKDLSNYAYYLNDKRLLQRTSELGNGKLPRGISLFLPIPEKRTCVDAEIPFWSCSCENAINQSIRPKLVEHLSREVIKWINKQISEYPHCATVSLNNIIYASLTPKILTSVNYTMTFSWHLIIEAEPGKMTFEASGRTVDEELLRTMNNSETVVENVYPRSTYRYRSLCEKNTAVKPFCFCKFGK